MAYQLVTPVKLGQAAIGITTSTLYTVPAATRTYLKDLDICNTSSTTSQTVTVYLVPSAGTAGAANTLIPGVNIPPNGMFQWSGTQVMDTGDTIQVVSSGTTITISASGGEAI